MNLDKENKEIRNNNRVKLDLEKIVKNLLCYLCGGIFRNPHTFSECTDTFCKACIYKYFLENRKKIECPKCLTNLGGRPFDSLIFDNSLNTLINIIFPEYEEKESLISNTLERLFIESSVCEDTNNKTEDLVFNHNEDCLQVRLESEETMEITEDLVIPMILIPKELKSISLKKFIWNYLKNKCKSENDIILSYDNCTIDDEDLSVEDLIKLYGIGNNEITSIKYSLKDNKSND
jgi:hypothetical protein